MSELATHLAIAEYLDLVIKSPNRWHTIEVSNQAGGWAAKKRQAALKQKGVTAGWPDIAIYWRSPRGLEIVFFEVKSEDGPVRRVQRDLHKELREEGHHVCVVRSVTDVREFLINLGVV